MHTGNIKLILHAEFQACCLQKNVVSVSICQRTIIHLQIRICFKMYLRYQDFNKKNLTTKIFNFYCYYCAYG